ncbi:UNVERIFIED_CONTAM: hypothetical protein GTU68_021629 [Idotea baltica]|nr:hypothetical protein [Idotea baltica]
MTKSASCMWKYVLGNKQMLGYQFLRERPILNYIADFVCLDILLVIEVDGITHQSDDVVARDARRDKALSDVGFTVLRFSSWEVLNQIEQVSITIGNWINANAADPPKGRRKRKLRSFSGQDEEN